MEPEAFARLIAILGLTAAAPAENAAPEPVTAEAVIAKVEELAAAAQTLADLQAQFDQVRADLAAKSAELQGLNQKKTEAEVDAILEQFAARLTTPEAQARLRALLLSDRESGMDILNGLPTPAAAAPAPAEEAPPAPQHDPQAPAEKSAMSEPEKLAAQNQLVTSIRKEVRNGATPFASYDAARGEARRRQPNLFA